MNAMASPSGARGHGQMESLYNVKSGINQADDSDYNDQEQSFMAPQAASPATHKRNRQSNTDNRGLSPKRNNNNNPHNSKLSHFGRNKRGMEHQGSNNDYDE